MYKVKTMNKISKIGLAQLDDRFEISDNMEHEDAILVRSAKLHDYDFPAELKAIARAGAGVNNIPLDRAADAGVVVFNTPGANANGVKELTIAALLLASRKIAQGIAWVKEQSAAGADIAAVVEKGKSAYVGPEIGGKTLGVVGLGAIGVMVANAAAGLGMKIVGYDPFLSVKNALNLTPGAEIVATLDELYGKADYISLHLPMNADTKGTVNAAAFAAMKDGVRIVNLARGELVDTAALKDALASGKCAAYVTDFPNSETAALDGVVCIPHLGASTPESEDNCAMMAARQVQDYLDNGNIVNSVNLPVLSMAWAAKNRVCVIAKGADAAAVTAAVPGPPPPPPRPGATTPTSSWTPTPTWTPPRWRPSPASSRSGSCTSNMGKIHPTAWVAPGAFLRGDVTLGEKVSIWYNAVLRADQETITVGKGSNIQDNCVLHGDPGHDVIVGENVTVGHGAILHGCTIEDQCLIGMNAVVLDNTVIGAGSIVGAGAVVGSGQTIPPRSLVLGVPAKVKKTLTEGESAGNLENVEEYFGLMAQAMADPANHQ